MVEQNGGPLPCKKSSPLDFVTYSKKMNSKAVDQNETLLSESLFSPYVCHVCKSPSEDLKTCSRCKLVSYCSVEHQKINWPIHSKICRCVSTVLTKFNASSIFQIVQEQCWVSQRSLAMCLVETVLNNSLKPWQRLLFMFPAFCITCQALKIDKNLICNNCYSVSYCCLSHQALHKEEHEKICDALKLCYDLNYEMTRYDNNYNLDIVKLLDINIKGSTTLPKNMNEFVGDILPYINCDEVKPEIVSEMLTCILTIIYSIEITEIISENNDELRITLVGCETGQGLESYLIRYIEIIPHWFPRLKKINFTFVSPNDNPPKIPKLCRICSSEKKISLDFFRSLYHDFVSSSHYKEPDVIFIFNCGFHEKPHARADTWRLTIPKLFDSKYFTAFTSYNDFEAQKDFDTFIEFKPCMKKINVLMECVENPFKSNRPHRDWEGDSIFYQNNYISVIQIKGDQIQESSGIG